MADTKGVALVLETPANPVVARTDARALHQIVLNLTNNAIKFTERGTVTLGLREISFGGKAMVEFSVKDTGSGIRPEDQDKLFQAFSQLNSSRRLEGTGLGLHLCQKLAERLHGSITFESEFGQGSTFRLTLHPE
jgi:signal transduction histidine kinase